MDQVIADIIAGINQQAGLGGWAAVVGGIGVVVTAAIRLFRMRWPERFNRLHPIAKIALPFAAAFAGSLIIGIAGSIAGGIALGSVFGKLVVAAIAAGVAAIGAHETSKVAGVTMDAAMIARDPNYQPGTLRKMSSLVVDLPKLPIKKDP